jgi:hypothetical protein
MKNHLPGLHVDVSQESGRGERPLLARVEQASSQLQNRKPILLLTFMTLNPTHLRGKTFRGRLPLTEKHFWRLRWFLRDFIYDADLLAEDVVDEKKIVGLQGVVLVSPAAINRGGYVHLEAFAPARTWPEVAAGFNDTERSQPA